MQKGRGKGLVFFAKCNVILVEFQLKETQFRQCLETNRNLSRRILGYLTKCKVNNGAGSLEQDQGWRATVRR